MEHGSITTGSTGIVLTAGRRTGRTAPDEQREGSTGSFSELLVAVKAEDLLRRRRGFYLGLIAVLTVALVAALVTVFLLGDSWAQLIVAAVLGIIFTQFAFLAHEAAHRQVFASAGANRWAGLLFGVFFVGLSHAWWMNKHSRHHANPNTIGRDPDIEKDTISFLVEDAAASRGIVRVITRKQGYLFFPLLLLEGINLHRYAVTTMFGRESVKDRGPEVALFVTRFALYLALVFLVMPLPLGLAFLGVQLAVFGLYMGASFAPNHKGMPLIPRGERVDFLRRQVLTSRNIHGGVVTDAFMGGLNYQVEHHLFPSMPRPALAQAQRIVRDYCARNGILYTEVGILASYGVVVRYLNEVGLAARDPFDCPARSQYSVGV